MKSYITALAVLVSMTGMVLAQETITDADAKAVSSAKPAPQPEKGAPLPLHQIEGNGGVGLTEMAYLVNPSASGSVFGYPSFSVTHIQAGRGVGVEVGSISETLWGRLELSYAYNYVGLGDFPDAVQDHLGANLSRSNVQLHNVNARVLLVKEGDFDQAWVPALTAGAHYKYNDGINDINHDLGGALHNVVGVDDNQGVDYTLTATKLFKDTLPRPFFVSATARNTDAAQLGWLGFTDHRVTVFEGNTGVFVTDKLILAAEFRQKPDQLKQVPGVLGPEDNWWTLAAAYIVNNHVTVSAAYANLGNVLNHDQPAALWLQLKVEL